MLTRDLDWDFSYADRKEAFLTKSLKELKLPIGQMGRPIPLNHGFILEISVRKREKLYAILMHFLKTMVR